MRYINKFLLSQLILLSISSAGLLTSCSKDNEVVEANNENYFYLDASVLGVASESGSKPALKASFNKSKSASTSKVLSLGDVFGEISIKEVTEHNVLPTKLASNATLKGEYPANVVAMVKGVKYMVIVYNEAGKVVGHQLCTVGDKTKVQVSRPLGGVVPNYTIVAFSFNNSNAADFTAIREQILSGDSKINIPTDKDFLYYNAEFSTAIGDESTLNNGDIVQTEAIQILFWPQTAKVTVKVEGSTMFGGVSDLEGTFIGENFNTGIFDIKENKVVSTRPYTEEEKSFKYTAGEEVASINKFTVLPTEVEGFKVEVNFSKLNITRLDTAYTHTLIAANNPRTIVLGTNLKLANRKQIEGKLSVFEGFQTGDIAWSMANLYFNPNDKYTHKFHVSPRDGRGAKYRASDYWSRVYRYPTDTYKKESDYEGDPCEKVYPYGTWKLPTEAQGNLLENVKEKTDFLYSQSYVRALEGPRESYISYKYKSKYPDYNSSEKELRFYGGGYFTLGDVFLRYSDTGTKNVSAFFMTSADGATSAGQKILAFNFYGDLDSDEETPKGVTDGFTDDLTNYTSGIRTNVRCVRKLN